MIAYHGTENSDWQPHIGGCLTTEEDVAADYGSRLFSMNFAVGALVVRRYDSDEAREFHQAASWPGDTAASIAGLLEDGVDVVVYDDETPSLRSHLTYRLISQAAVAACTEVGEEG